MSSRNLRQRLQDILDMSAEIRIFTARSVLTSYPKASLFTLHNATKQKLL